MRGHIQNGTEQSATSRFVASFRNSPTAYLVSLVLTVVLSSYANYVRDRVDPSGFTVMGQSPGIYLPFLLFPLSFILWLLCRDYGVRNIWLSVFLGGLAVSWCIQYLLIRIHGDLYIHSVWLFLPVLAMIWWKPPTWSSAWNVLRVLAVSAVLVMAITFALEKLDLIPQFLAEGSTAPAFESENYWLPLMDIMQLDGRWHGPFGYASKTAFISAFVLLVGLVDKGWGRWILVAAGSVGLLLTGSRGAYLALAAAIGVVLLFARGGPIGRINIWLRLVVGAVGFFLVSFLLFTQGALGLTGREPLWSGFLNIWRESIWLGVGQSGIASSPRIVEWMEPSWMDAHSIYVQELTKGGVLGFASVFTVVAIGLFVAFLAAIRGFSLPFAIITVYLVAGMTDLLHNGWTHYSIPNLLILMSVLGATSYLSQERNLSRTNQD
jgi:hypothetical protein